MSGDIHLPRLPPEKMHLLLHPTVDSSSLSPATAQNSAADSRVKSETRYPASDMLTEEEKQSAKEGRRSSFPPIPRSRDSVPGGKVTKDSPRQSLSEVVARMHVREKTLMGETFITKTSVNGGGGAGDTPTTNGTIHEDGVDGQDRETDPVAEKPTQAPTPRVIKSRKNGIIVPLKAWVTPREHAHAALEIRGAPVFFKTGPWKESVSGPSVVPELEPEHHQDAESEDALGGPDHNEAAVPVAGDIGDVDFDFDEGEAELEAQRRAIRLCYTTPAVYRKACMRLRIQPAPAFLRQCNVASVQLCDAGLGAADVKPIAIALVRDRMVSFLDLSNNDLGPMGVSYMAEMLQENRTILDINLSGTNPGREGLRALSETLRYNRKLLYLRLEENNIQHTEAPLLADIIRSVPRLQCLYLGHNKLGYRGGVSIAAALAQNTSLQTLDLQWNHIRRDSGVALIRSLAKNSRLRQLNLAWNGLGKEGCLALAHVLPVNAALRELDLTCNRVDLLSLGFLLRGLAANSGLRTLKLAQNPITTEGAKALVQTISSSADVALTQLDILGVPVDQEFTQLLSQAQKGRLLYVQHDETMSLATSDRSRQHDGNNLDHYDPVMVLFEYMKLDNLRVIDMFQYMDVKKRDKLSKGNIRDGLNTLRIPVTEHAIDVIVQKLDLNKDGFVELDEMMKVQRDTARQVKLRQIKAKAKKREDESLNTLHQILRQVISKRTEENESRRESQQGLALTGGGRRRSSVADGGGDGGGGGGHRRRSSVVAGGGGGGRRKSSVVGGGLQVTLQGSRRQSVVSPMKGVGGGGGGLRVEQLQQPPLLGSIPDE